MKKSLFVILAVASASMAVAQSGRPAANAILLSETRNGNTITTRYLIPHDNGKHAEFDLHYTVNRSDIQPSYSTNKEQMNELNEFMVHTKDTTMHLSTIHIVGYASPDGNSVKNDTLAAHRASALYHYAVNTYHPKQKIDVEHHTYHWSDVAKVVQESAIPNKQEVLQILNSNNSESDKEAHLRKLAAAWSFLATNILPQMRYADIEFDYGVDEVVTRTTLVSQPAPATSATPATPATTQPVRKEPEVVVVDEEMGIIVAMPKSNAEQRKEYRKEHHKDEKSKKSKKN